MPIGGRRRATKWITKLEVKMSMKNSLACILTATVTAVSINCDSDTVKVYRVSQTDSSVTQPAPQATEPASASTDASPAQSGTPAPSLTYTLPVGWKEAVPGNMRVASFLVANPNGRPADVGVIPMPTAMQESALVKMWRQQLRLSATAGAGTDTGGTDVTIGDGQGKLYDMASDALIIDNKSRGRILVAMFPHGTMNWFFKMVGEESFVEAQKPAFVQFLKSVFIGDQSAASAMDLHALPPSHPAIFGTNAETAMLPEANANSAGKPTWTVPAGWQTGQLSQFLVAKFVIAGEGDAKAEVNVSALSGTGGGLLPNINRWRGQLGLGPIEQNDLGKTITTLDAAGIQASIMDFNGMDGRTGKKARLVGVILPLGGQTWFYKLMGDERVVAQQKDAFAKFIQSAKYPNAN